MTVSAPLARVLAEDRCGFNARIASTRKLHPGFDTSAFATFLDETVDQIVLVIEAVAPERVQAVTTVAFDMALDLVAHGLAGPRAHQPWATRAWEDVAPHYASLIAAQPEAVLGALGNAVMQLSRWPQVRIVDWLDGMTRLAGQVSGLTQMQALGQVLAWRAGMAHYRHGALAAAQNLPPALALAALGADPDDNWPDLHAALLEDPWHTAQGRAHGLPATGIEAGAFSGFGGSFAQPPQVRAAGEGFVVCSADRYQHLVVDINGAVLLPASKEQFDAATTATAPAPTPLITARGWPHEGLACAADAHTLAITTPFSHHVALFPRT